MATAEGKSISSLCWVTPTNITFTKANLILKPNEAKDSHMAKSNIKRQSHGQVHFTWKVYFFYGREKEGTISDSC